MINRYVLLVGVFATAAGLLTAMGYTLESHAAPKTVAATDTVAVTGTVAAARTVAATGMVRCHFDPALRQEAITDESARAMTPERLHELVSQRIENLKSTGLSDEQLARIERLQIAHARRNAQIAQAIDTELARPDAVASRGVTPDTVARLQREQVAVDVMVWNHAHDVLNADQKLRLQLGCREGSPSWAWFAGAFRKS